MDVSHPDWNKEKKKLLFIYNPRAGKSLIKNKLSDIIEIFIEKGYEVTIYATRGTMDATNIVKNLASDYDLVVCSGGDGTLNEITDGLMCLDRRPVCGYIPAGTVNDFASSLKLSKNMITAATTIVDGEPFAYDIGSLNGDYFTYFAGFGAFTDVSYETPQASKNVLGKMAYVLEGVKRLPNIKSYHMTLKYDGITIEDEFIFGMITNSNSVGGFKGLNGKDVLLDDGLFEVAFIKMPKNPIELQAIINALIMRELNNDYMYSFHTAKLHIVAEQSVPWTVDGEFADNYSEVEVQVHKQAIRFLKSK